MAPWFINVSFVIPLNIKFTITHIIRPFKTFSRTKGPLWNWGKKSCIKHGVGCDYSKLITKNNNFRRGALKNEDCHSFTIWQLFNLAPNLKQYVFAKLFPKKLIVLIESNRTTTLDIAIDPHMVVIQIHVRKNLVEDVLLDGWSRLNIIVDDLLKKLGLPTPRLTLYTL